MPVDMRKEWDELRKRIEETMQSECKIKNNFEYKDLCKYYINIILTQTTNC